jgi:hypothetical protein
MSSVLAMACISSAFFTIFQLHMWGIVTKATGTKRVKKFRLRGTRQWKAWDGIESAGLVKCTAMYGSDLTIHSYETALCKLRNAKMCQIERIRGVI